MELMIDLETLSLNHNAAVLSIGAVAFDQTQITKELEVAINPDEIDRYGLHVDVDTVKWWMTQSAQAQASSFNGTMQLQGALSYLTELVDSTQPTAIWFNGFKDSQWLSNLYKVANMPCPWPYYIERDFRTAKSMLPQVQIADEAVAHNALADARWQARYLTEARKAHTEEVGG